MGTKANVAVLPQDTAKLRIEELLLPDPGPTQVVVKQFASGVCHSQLHQRPRPRNSPPVCVTHSYTKCTVPARHLWCSVMKPRG